MQAGQPVLILHGGVGFKGKDEARAGKKLALLKTAALKGYQNLLVAGSAVDAVEIAINIMEDSGLFNAGLGAVKQADGQSRLDASIMRSYPLGVGAVASLRGVQHPITVARKIMEETPHNMIAHDFAWELAQKWKIPCIEGQKSSKKNTPTQGDTVGVVALDSWVHLAAGTSTGGLQKTMPGRIGDTPIIGAGTYANQFAGASATGIGENIMKLSITRLISFFIEFEHNAPQTAVDRALAYYKQYFDAILGIICLDAHGQWGIGFLGQVMPWAICSPTSEERYELRYGDSKSDCIIETFTHAQMK